MRPIVIDGVAWYVGLSVARSVTVVSPAKTAEPIEPFGLWTRIGPRNRVLDGVQMPIRRGHFEGKGAAIVKFWDSLPGAVEKWLNRWR